jgi:hypothetical protein
VRLTGAFALAISPHAAGIPVGPLNKSFGKVMESFAGGWFVDTTFFNSRCRVPHKKDKYQGSAAYPVAPFERIAATGIFERAGRFGWKDPSSSLIWSASMGLE